MLLPACIRIEAPTQQVATPPVVVITQVVTEMIPPTPLPVTPTAEPTATALPPTLTPTWDPLSAPIYYPLDDCVASRLHVGDKAMVSLVGGANGIRYGRDLAESTIDWIRATGRYPVDPRRTVVQPGLDCLVCQDCRWDGGVYSRGRRQCLLVVAGEINEFEIRKFKRSRNDSQ